jgi:23S rRNA pseudouridine2604 synthase
MENENRQGRTADVESKKQEIKSGTEGVRLNKFLSESGFCSRREADRLIEAGKVKVDGMTASMGQKVEPGQKVEADGTVISGKDRPVVLLVNKPRGIVCTTSDKDRAENIVEFLNYPVRVYPVGRLDKDSEGLLLMTNQGELVNQILKGRYGHEKEYLVTVNKEITASFLERMKGVKILDTVTRPCTAEQTGEKSFRIILTQGLNRQIRRMCEALGYRVKTLKRVRIMNLELGSLKTGEYREITKEEYRELKRLLEGRAGRGNL